MVEGWVILIFHRLHDFVQVFCNKYILLLIIIKTNFKILKFPNYWEGDWPPPGLSTCGGETWPCGTRVTPLSSVQAGCGLEGVVSKAHTSLN